MNQTKDTGIKPGPLITEFWPYNYKEKLARLKDWIRISESTLLSLQDEDPKSYLFYQVKEQLKRFQKTLEKVLKEQPCR